MLIIKNKKNLVRYPYNFFMFKYSSIYIHRQKGSLFSSIYIAVMNGLIHPGDDNRSAMGFGSYSRKMK